MLKQDVSRTLEFFGEDFPKKLFNSIVGSKIIIKGDVHRDDSFGKKFFKICKEEYFSNGLYKHLFNVIKYFYEKYDQIPYYDEIELMIKTSKFNDVVKTTLLKELQIIANLKNDYSYNSEFIEQNALNFVKFQSLLVFSKQIEEFAYSGNYEEYDSITDKLIETVTLTDVEENHYITEAGNYDDLDHPRIPIPIGWGEGFDKALNGGLAKGELMICVLGSGVGKTTLATIAAESIQNLGLNVVQIFFEDTTQQIRQKQRAKWTGLPISQINRKGQKEETLAYIKKVSDEKISKANAKGGHWILKKFKSTGTTPDHVRNYLKKLKTRYKIEPHFVIIDYLECMDILNARYTDDWKKEKEITRHLESIASNDEFGIPMIAFTQGNRGAMNNEFVDVTEMGGDFSKYKIGHVVASMAKTKEMKAKKTANASILKSRVGADGISFRGFLFDNATLQINITPQSVEDVGEGEVTDKSKTFATKK